MRRARGLGRGLDALLGGDGANDEASMREIPVAALTAGKFQPRTRMDEDSLAALADSIKSKGVVQPIVVRPIDSNQYEIVAGERRWRAAAMAGLENIPAVVREVADDSAGGLALLEKIKRGVLNPLEEAGGIQRLIEEFHMTHQQAAEAVGRSRAGVTNLLRLLNLAPTAQELLMQGRIEMGHARAMLALSTPRQAEMAELISARALSVRETETLVRKWLNPPAAKRSKDDRDVLRLQEELSERLGTTVTLQQVGKGAGKLVIHYTSLDQLETILARLR
ncbi:MAG: ParB/RepB/Spo0J family partition protein [Burkholderiales bacterium]